MKFPEPRTLGGAMSLVILANWLFAIGIFEYPIGYPRPWISLCWSIAHFIIFLSSIILAEASIMTQIQSSAILSGSYRLFISSIILSILVFQYFGRTASKKVVASLRKLNKVNEMLGKYEISKEYGLTYRYQIIQLTSASLYMIIILALEIYVSGYDNYNITMTQVGHLAVVHYTPACSCIIDCTFTSFIRYIGNRFKHLNSNLMQCSSQEYNRNSFIQDSELDDSLRPMTLEIHANLYSFRLTNKQWIIQLIRHSRKIHEELCATARIINEAFGTQILLSMTITFVLITTRLYIVYNSLVNSTLIRERPTNLIITLIIIVLWLILYTVKILYIVSVCSMTCTQAQKMGQIIHRFDSFTSDRQVRKEIQVFSLLLIRNPLQFTAREFLTLDYEMICSMVGTVTTYLVIMIQLQNIYDPTPRPASAISRAINGT